MTVSLDKINKTNGKILTQDDIAKLDNNATKIENAINNLDDNKANITYESPIIPTMINSWVDYGSPYSTVGYWKDSLGYVHLKGTIKGGVSNSIAFQLPEGYRPSTNIRLVVSGLGSTTQGDSIGTCVVIVSALGNIIPSVGLDVFGYNNEVIMSIVCLENISFRVGV